MLKNVFKNLFKITSTNGILFAGAAIVITLGVGLVTMSGAKFTSNTDTGNRVISAGVLKPLDYSFEDTLGNPLTTNDVNDLFTSVYPGWTKSIDVVVKTTADTTLNADWAPVLGGTFIDTPSLFDDRIVVSVIQSPTSVGDFAPDATVSGKSLAELGPLAATYNDSTTVTGKYVKLGTGELDANAGETTKFRLTFSFKDADAGKTAYEDMGTYDPSQLDNQYMGNTAAFDLVLKAVILDQN